MDIFMRNVPYTVDEFKITLRVASVLHSPQFERYALSPGLPINFKVYLHPDKRYRRQPHSGSGTLTVPTEKIGQELLNLYRSSGINVDGRLILLQKSNKQPRKDTLGEIQLLPYRNPYAILEKEKRRADLSGKVQLQDVQFGWICRDNSFSIEWQWNHGETAPPMNILFHEETREIFVQRSDTTHVTTISTRYSRVRGVETEATTKSIILFLMSPPSLERGSVNLFPSSILLFPSLKQKRRKLTQIDPKHAIVAPFTWETMRLVCDSLTGLAEFERMADLANLVVHDNQHRPVEHRGLFSANLQEKLQNFLRQIDWSVAFQCEALYRDSLLDTVELLGLSGRISELVRSHGAQHTTQLLREFRLYLQQLIYSEEAKSVESCFTDAVNAIDQSGPDTLQPNTDRGLFQCLHVTFTPTGMILRGPFPDTSNRILRQHWENQEAFLRVSFTDEDNLHFKFDRREVDAPRFIEERVGTILKNGFDLCGRRFEFLAYSQSALKQYTVWFVTEFKDKNGRVFNSESIRETIGSSWPTQLRRCPARYAARLSQAFTATEPSLVVEPDQVQRSPDIERNGYCFSDGNGLVSKSMADAIHDALQRGAGRTNRSRRTPSVFQVRIQGAKGVLSVDRTLDDFVIILRPSMVKFESANNYDVEIARSFNKPGKFFLNRPLIMILEGLGIDAEVFLKLQRDAVEETQQASKSLKGAAELLETHGLGSAFALPSIFSNLRKLGINFEEQITSSGVRNAFMNRCMQFAVHHVLREIKFRARVPVPGSWKLVGVVDVHNILQPNEIYACLVRAEGAKPEYLQGPILISKSPTIHPGDVQMAKAIGAPPPGSPLHALSNCVVFSQRGDRPLPNKLSGSDLDGDEYDLVPLPLLHPDRANIAEPGGYPPAPRKILDQDSTINDVADFVVDFINSDVLGIVATNFLLIADRAGIFAPDCATLAELHSWAVDFPKNGVPVPIEKIPQSGIRVRPDWHAPEISTTEDADYYESRTALGKLFRDIQLPPLSAGSYRSRAQQHRRRKKEKEFHGAGDGGTLSLQDTLQRLSLGTGPTAHTPSDPISTKLRRRLLPLVDLDETDETLTTAMSDLFDHFAAELEHICFSYTLSRRSTTRLTEEEVFVGTIVAKSAQPRMRRDNTSSMREETSVLVRRMLLELEGGEDTAIKDWVNRAWAAWRVSLMKKDMFGSESFGWIALRAIFETIKYLDD